MSKKKMRKIITVQLVQVPNDVNGNPRRFFRIYDRKLNYLGWTDDSYAGTNFVGGRKVKWLPRTEMPYRKSLRLKEGVEFENEKY